MPTEDFALGETVAFDVVTHSPVTGTIADATSGPTFDVYPDDDDTGLLGATAMTKRGELTGHYRGAVEFTEENGFEIGKTYSIVASATLAGVSAKHVVMMVRVIDPEAAAAGGDIYHADIEYTPDSGEGRDEFTVTWFKSGVRVASGITDAKIQIVARDDGSDLVAETAMTEVGETGTFAYNESSDRIPVAEAALIIVSATIDGETRSFSKLVTGY